MPGRRSYGPGGKWVYHYQTKTAMFHGFFDELEKISQDPLGGSAAPASMPAPSTPQQDPASMIGRKAPNMGGGTSPPGAGAPSMPGTGIGT